MLYKIRQISKGDSLDELAEKYGEVMLYTPRIAFIPAPDAEAKVQFVDWLEEQMPIGTATIQTLRAYGLTAFADWCEEFNKQFDALEAERGQDEAE